MKTPSISKLGALALIVGPVLGLAAFLLEPGGLLLDRVDAIDELGKIKALASNSAIAHTVAPLIALGLTVMLYGFNSLKQTLTDNTNSAALARFGIFSLTVGGFGWILAQGFTYILAQTQIDSEQMLSYAIPIQKTDTGITLISGVVIAIGILALSSGLSARESVVFHKITSLVISVVSIIFVAAAITGYVASNESFITLGRACYFPWTIWGVMLGVRHLKSQAVAPNPA